MNIQLSEHFTYKKLLRFILPSIIMMVFTSIYSVVDGIFVSNFVGKSAFASVNLIMPYLMGISALGFMIGTEEVLLYQKPLVKERKNWQISIFRCWLRLLLSEDLCYLFSVLYL